MMKHIKLYEEFMTQGLDSKTKTEYIEELEKHVSMPDLYQNDLVLWSAIVGGLGPEDIDPEELELGSGISSEEYQEMLDDYEHTASEQHELNYLMRMIQGYGDDPDEDDYYTMKSEEYEEKLRGLDPKLIMMAMSLGKQQMYFNVEWVQVK
jgi:hypothetical protein